MTDDELTQLLLDAIAFAMEIRDDVAAAHRIAASWTPLRARQICCVLGAMVDPNKPIDDMAWWRDLPEAREAA